MATPPVFTAGQVLTAAQMNKIGLWEVYPETAVTGVSTITRDGVFTSDFTNYLLIITGTNASSGNMNMQFRVGGVTAATNYNAQFLYVSSNVVSTAHKLQQLRLLLQAIILQQAQLPQNDKNGSAIIQPLPHMTDLLLLHQAEHLQETTHFTGTTNDNFSN